MIEIMKTYIQRIVLTLMLIKERCRRIRIASQGIVFYLPIGSKALMWLLFDICILVLLMLTPILLLFIFVNLVFRVIIV